MRITAHRQTWLASNNLEFSPSQKLQQENFIKNQDRQETARWKDDHASAKTSITIYDLLDAENMRARRIAALVDLGDLNGAQLLSNQPAPIQIINALFSASNIPISISLGKNDSILASKNGGELYSVAELSDGERNALLIAGSVLTAQPESLILIDEPERHLHRSIISPFLTQLIARRADCAFVVSTHDIELPMDHPEAQSLLVRSCVYVGSKVASWDADILAPNDEIDDSIKADIIGGRRKILFVEGQSKSLDKPLYSILFPNISVVAKESCKDVESHVKGISGSAELHWVKPFGVVDKDQLDASAITELQSNEIFPLNVYSVEGLYYHPKTQRRIAERHAAVTGGDVDSLLSHARAVAITSVLPHVERLAKRIIERTVKHKLLLQAPVWKDLTATKPVEVTVDVPSLLSDETNRLNDLLSESDLEGLIARYPVRETPMLKQIAAALGFTGRAQYEAAVRKLVTDDEEARAEMISFFDGLPVALQVN